jgi:Putative zinc-finger
MSREHTDIGAYSLGLLEEHDRLAFEDHLAGCPSCAAELADLSGMSALLSGIEPVEPADGQPAGGEVVDLLRRRATAEHRRARWQVTAAAAAAIVLLAGGVTVGIETASSSSGSAPGVAVAGQQHHATDPATGVTGTVGLVAKGWGTQVTLDLSKVRGPLECQLVAVSKTGERRVLVGWLVPAAGYGVPGHPAPLIIQGGTSIKRDDLSRLLVNEVNGTTILTIAV